MKEEAQHTKTSRAGTGVVSCGAGEGARRFVGLDLGTETVKAVEVRVEAGGVPRWTRRERIEHGKEPARALVRLLEGWDWEGERVDGAAVTGAWQGLVTLPGVPVKQAQARGSRFLRGEGPMTVVSIGSRGFSVLELRADGLEVFRQNSRCSQGTGNFLRQLLERLSLTVEEADAMSAEVVEAAVLSARCPVILKTDVTHLANRGEDRARIVAGCFDALCANVETFLKPGSSPDGVVLIGGVTQARRVRRYFREHLARLGLRLEEWPADEGLYVEALGCALMAASVDPGRSGGPVEGVAALLRPRVVHRLDLLPPLSASLARVRRLPCVPPGVRLNGEPRELILGLDIGSTGSKAVALLAEGGEVVWRAYRPTLGDPVGAAQALVGEFDAHCGPGHGTGHDLAETFAAGSGRGREALVRAVGVTGSGREIVGALLATCHGAERVYILNEIAAHAAGAVHFDARVDTIFEIGGQDAKYIRLEAGRVVDCAMNEACSAGTGSFLEEQGRKFAGVREVGDLARQALRAGHGVSLGQHCSVFMAEMIDQAVVAGVEPEAIMAGLHDSVIQNYLHRVKGNRPVGRVVFCQGMPFASDALAAAVARQTGVEVIVPPDPGMVGALGIALLARREGVGAGRPAIGLRRFLAAQVAARDTFRCGSTRGCGGQGQHCRIERLSTRVEGRSQRFTWGGGCGLHDRGFQRRKLPDRAPDPFRERDGLIEEVAGRAGSGAGRGAGRVALTDEFMLKTHYPFFARFLMELGFEVVTVRGADHAVLQRGLQLANVPFCAPMQLFHGLSAILAETGVERILVPRIRYLPRRRDEVVSINCPMVQASADIVGWDLGARLGARLVSPLVDFGVEPEGSARAGRAPRWRVDVLAESCRRLAHELGVGGGAWRAALRAAREEQARFEERCEEIGRRALAFCAREDLPPVVVLGRPYTIHNTVLNSNVPAILREQGALAIPADCLPVPADTPEFEGMYWGHGRRILRAAHAVRGTAGLYGVFCSNYSCGPDSFGLHFCSRLMQGKPFVIIETDGHAGDAGTRTRIEAFLHCVHHDRRGSGTHGIGGGLGALRWEVVSLTAARERGDRVLVPFMGPNSEVLAACLRGAGFRAEALPASDPEALQAGRRHTSGKECLPLCLTLGGILRRVEAEPGGTFTVIMPHTLGPCRQGMYQLFDRLVVDELGWRDRVRFYSPCDEEYFVGLPAAFALRVVSAIVAADLLHGALLEVRPVEEHPGAAEEVYARCTAELLRRCAQPMGGRSVVRALGEIASGRLFGLGPLLNRAGAAFAAVRDRGRAEPATVLLGGEHYVRLDPFANDGIVKRLEAHGLRVWLVPMTEWLDYCSELPRRRRFGARCRHWVDRTLQRRILDGAFRAMGRSLGWLEPFSASEAVAAGARYVRPALEGEAVLTLGTALLNWRSGRIDGVVSVGPLECMPSKVAEAQFFHVTEREGLPALTLSFNGEPLEASTLEAFVFEVKARRARGGRSGASPVPVPAPRR